MYGTNLRNPAKIPHSAGEGIPIAQSPRAITMPKQVFTANCDRKYLLSRAAASSIARVVRCRSFDPNTRMNRSRKSSLCISTKIATIRTMIVVSSGPRIGASTVRAIMRGDVLPCTISTGTGRLCPGPTDAWIGDCGIAVIALPLPSCFVIDARRATAKTCTRSTLASIVLAWP